MSSVIGQIYRYLRDPWLRSSRARRSRERLLALRDRHAGSDITVLATGSSLLETDLSAYADMPKIGLNRLYLAHAQLGVRPDYHIVANDLLAEQFSHELEALEAVRFMPWTARRHFRDNADTVFVNFADGEEFQPEHLDQRLPVGATVTVAALHLAFWLGARRVYLLGVDHHYELERHEEALSPHEVSQRNAADRNHIHPDYFGAGTRWQLPDLQMSERAYANARRYFEAHGRTIINATPGSRLDVFERTG